MAEETKQLTWLLAYSRLVQSKLWLGETKPIRCSFDSAKTSRGLRYWPDTRTRTGGRKPGRPVATETWVLRPTASEGWRLAALNWAEFGRQCATRLASSASVSRSLRRPCPVCRSAPETRLWALCRSPAFRLWSACWPCCASSAAWVRRNANCLYCSPWPNCLSCCAHIWLINGRFKWIGLSNKQCMASPVEARAPANAGSRWRR